MNTTLSNLLLFLVLSLSSTCWGLLTSGDNNPVSIESSTLELDQQNGLATYSGNVIVKQNGKELLADKVIMYKNAQGKMDKILAFGKPAKYTGTNKEEPVFGEANKITFLTSKQDMILEGQAKLTQKKDSFTAPFITYNLQSKMIRSKSQEGIRPTIIFHPN